MSDSSLDQQVSNSRPDQPPNADQKKPYVAPELRPYGDVVRNTHSKAGGSTDGPSRSAA